MPDDVEELQTRLRQLQLLSQGLLEGERAAIQLARPGQSVSPCSTRYGMRFSSSSIQTF